MGVKEVGYNEKRDCLSIRIEAHKKYSNFSLDDWLSRNLSIKEGQSLLDIGCGDGNFFGLYGGKLGRGGLVVGIDQSDELLEKASKRETAASTLLLKWSMNDTMPFVPSSFNAVISTFAIYYVDDVSRILGDIKRVLRDGGEMLLIGPTDANAKELYDFNELVFGIKRDEKIGIRTNRLQTEFAPAAQGVFKNCRIETIPSKIQFPSQDEFIRYYKATLLFEESLKKTFRAVTDEYLKSIPFPAWEISKEMAVVRGEK